MKKFFLFIFFFVVVLVLTTYWAAHNLLPNYLVDYINNNLSEKIKMDVAVNSIKIDWAHPLKIQIKGLQVGKAETFQAQPFSAIVTVEQRAGLFNFDQIHPVISVVIENAKIKLFSKTGSEQAAPADQTNQQLPINDQNEITKFDKRLKDISVTIKLVNSRITSEKDGQPDIDISAKFFQFIWPNIKSPMRINFDGQILASQLFVPTWIAVKADVNTQLTQGKIILQASTLELMNLKTTVSGSVDLVNKRLSLDSYIQAPDLQKLPLPKTVESPIKSWKGSLSARVITDGPFSELNSRGSVKIANGVFDMNFKNPKVQLTGPVMINLDGQFLAALATKTFTVPNAEWNINLTKTQIVYDQLFKKDAATVLESKGEASYSKTLKLDEFQMKLAQLDVTANGMISEVSPSQIHLEIKPTQLVGLEKIFLPLSQYPLQGKIAIKADINGLLSDPKLLNIDISSMNLENLSTYIAFKTDEMEIKGPIKADLRGQISAMAMNVRSGQIQLSSDLTGLFINYKKLFKKAAQQPFSIKADARSAGGRLDFKNANIVLPFGSINIKGAPPVTLSSPMDLKIELAQINLEKLAGHSEDYRSLIPKGMVSGQLGFKGYLDSKEFMKSPLAISGNINADLPEYVMAHSPPAVDIPEEPLPEPKPAPAFLPDTPLIRQAQVQLQLKLGRFQKDTIEMKSISALVKLASNVATVKAQVGQIFGGSVEIEDLKVPLTLFNPSIQYQAKLTSINIESAIKNFKPEFEKILSGLASGQIKGQTNLPGTPQFLQQIQAEGELNVSKAVMNTVKVADLLKDLLDKIPDGKGSELAKRGPLEMDIASEFKLQQGKINFKKFNGVTTRKEQLVLTGTADLEANLDLTGSLFLVDQALTGSFYEANKDAQGRLEVPIRLQGNALNPDYKLAEGTISTMLGKTLEFEKKKLTAQAEAQVQKQVDQTKEDLQKKLAEELKKKASQLFK